ncbi:MAG: hypothetical protein [Caudovirales sp. ctOwN3]|nr:MAG: hypothetical protein [Caudovirales sp. ctOwN3]
MLLNSIMTAAIKDPLGPFLFGVVSVRGRLRNLKLLT